ncbi:MAG: hypothetical protein LC804_25775 [Acidobacteria bacterium]|nr:hypothetical protein [Acidobacteriota bacterium]
MNSPVARGVLAAACIAAFLWPTEGRGAQTPFAAQTFDAAWQIVQDTHFDPLFNGVDWSAVREELRPRALEAQSTTELRAIIGAMLGRLRQSHFVLLPADAGPEPHGITGDQSGAPGFDVRLAGDSVLVTSVEQPGAAHAAGVRAGWVVNAIAGRAIADVLDDVPSSHSRRRALEGWRLIVTGLRGAPGTTIPVEFLDAHGASRTLSIARTMEVGAPTTIGHLPTFRVRVRREALETPDGRRVGLVAFNAWMTPVDPEFAGAVDEFRQADGMIVDLRGNPGGLAAMLMGISGHFLGEPRTLGTMKTRDTELRFVVNPRRVNPRGERVEPYRGPLAILIDELTGSASECFAGGMQSIGRARVIGRTSMGQALPSLFDRLPNGDVLIHAYGDFVTASGTRLEGRGVVPDETIPLDRTRLLEGRDEAVGAALRWIDRQPHGGR